MTILEHTNDANWSDASSLNGAISVRPHNRQMTGERTSVSQFPNIDVLLVTFNDRRYIEKAIEGIFLQDYMGRIRVIVADDASTDGTLDLIRRTAAAQSRIEFEFLAAGPNLGITRNYQRGFAACHAEFVAVLEGDDYWSSPGKLSKQISFLEEHGECVACSSNYYIFDEAISSFELRVPKTDGFVIVTSSGVIHDNLPGNFSTSVYRREALLNLPAELFSLASYDWAVHLCLVMQGVIGVLCEPLSVFRQHNTGVWSNLTHRQILEIQFSLIPKYDALTQQRFSSELNLLSQSLQEQLAQGEDESLWHAPSPDRRLAYLFQTVRRNIKSFRRWTRPLRGKASRAPVRPTTVRQPSHHDHFIVLPFPFSMPETKSTPKVAVMLHCYYFDELQGIQRYLANIPFDFTLVISTDTSAKKDAIKRAFAGWRHGAVEVIVTENRGRDVAPRFVSLREKYAQFEYVLHIHTKKSVHNNALKGWLRQNLADLLGSPDTVRGIFEVFRCDPSVGIISPRYFQPIRQAVQWGVNFEHCQSLGQRMGFEISADEPIDFPAGSMFWARTAALGPLLGLNLQTCEFEPEQGQQDGTLAHAVERMVFISSELAGYGWCFVGQARNFDHNEQPIRLLSSADIRDAVKASSRSLTAVRDRRSPPRRERGTSPEPRSRWSPLRQEPAAQDQCSPASRRSSPAISVQRVEQMGAAAPHEEAGAS
jgi:hypothetical protein